MPTNAQKDLYTYIGYASQSAILLLVSVVIGYAIDKKFACTTPLFTWSIPVLVMIIGFIKIILSQQKKSPPQKHPTKK